MKRLLFFICVSASFINVAAQEVLPVDEKYLEDQLYIAFTYNMLLNRPANISQHGLSAGVNVGFIKDVPFNKNRNIFY